MHHLQWLTLERRFHKRSRVKRRVLQPSRSVGLVGLVAVYIPANAPCPARQGLSRRQIDRLRVAPGRKRKAKGPLLPIAHIGVVKNDHLVVLRPATCPVPGDKVCLERTGPEIEIVIRLPFPTAIWQQIAFNCEARLRDERPPDVTPLPIQVERLQMKEFRLEANAPIKASGKEAMTRPGQRHFLEF